MASKQLVVVTSLATVALASAALAGGIERFCPGGSGGGASVVEVWTNPVNVPWQMASWVGNWPAPGFAHIQCAGNPPSSSSPVAQSIYGALSAWNNASLNASVPNVSGFSFASPASPSITSVIYPGPGILPPGEGNLRPKCWWNPNSLPDSLNTITLWDGSGTFTAGFGGPAALAVAGVVANTNGTIVQCDIALNARGPFTFTGAPTWSFVEFSEDLGVTMATQSVHGTGTFLTPIAGFADLQGVLTHEMGHFAGLGHSLVDSTISPTTSLVPTMFAIAQAEPNFTDTIGLHSGGTPGNCTFNSVDVSTTLEFFGRSARDLELDDKWAIADGYPLPPANAYWANTGRITGTIRTNANATLRGASVIAIDAADPNVRRVGTLSLDQGNYQVTGLAPGNYFVKVQQVDWGRPGSYFFQGDVPNYVQAPVNWGCVGPLPPLVTTEWFDSNESGTEFSNMNATAVAVTAGQASVADIRLNADVNHLTVSGTANPNAASPRGVQLAPGGTATFFVTGGVPGDTAFVWLDLKYTLTPFGSQLGEVDTVAVFSGVVGPTGVATISVPVNASHLHNNFFAQGLFGDSSGNLILTNSVNFWVN